MCKTKHCIPSHKGLYFLNEAEQPEPPNINTTHLNISSNRGSHVTWWRKDERNELPTRSSWAPRGTLAPWPAPPKPPALRPATPPTPPMPPPSDRIEPGRPPKEIEGTRWPKSTWGTEHGNLGKVVPLGGAGTRDWRFALPCCLRGWVPPLVAVGVPAAVIWLNDGIRIGNSGGDEGQQPRLLLRLTCRTGTQSVLLCDVVRVVINRTVNASSIWLSTLKKGQRDRKTVNKIISLFWAWYSGKDILAKSS